MSPRAPKARLSPRNAPPPLSRRVQRDADRQDPPKGAEPPRPAVRDELVRGTKGRPRVGARLWPSRPPDANWGIVLRCSRTSRGRVLRVAGLPPGSAGRGGFGTLRPCWPFKSARADAPEGRRLLGSGSRACLSCRPRECVLHEPTLNLPPCPRDRRTLFSIGKVRRGEGRRGIVPGLSLERRAPPDCDGPAASRTPRGCNANRDANLPTRSTTQGHAPRPTRPAARAPRPARPPVRCARHNARRRAS
jgi:hypothetical protein